MSDVVESSGPRFEIARLQAELAELAAVNRAKDRLIAAVSHELRTPLTGIVGWLDLMEMRDTDDEVRRIAIEGIRVCASAQTALVEDLLDISRIALGKLHVERQPFVLSDAVAQAVQAVLPVASSKSIAIERRCDSAAPRVDGDPRRLRQVMWNLLSNAVKFTPAGGRIDIAERSSDRHVLVTVRDDGQGISGELLPHIFEPLRQEAGGDRKGGLGLGLAIARHLVQRHDGTISAFSEGPGRGATFTVCLPRAS